MIVSKSHANSYSRRSIKDDPKPAFTGTVDVKGISTDVVVSVYSSGVQGVCEHECSIGLSIQDAKILIGQIEMAIVQVEKLAKLNAERNRQSQLFNNEE